MHVEHTAALTRSPRHTASWADRCVSALTEDKESCGVRFTMCVQRRAISPSGTEDISDVLNRSPLHHGRGRGKGDRVQFYGNLSWIDLQCTMRGEGGGGRGQGPVLWKPVLDRSPSTHGERGRGRGGGGGRGQSLVLWKPVLDKFSAALLGAGGGGGVRFHGNLSWTLGQTMYLLMPIAPSGA